MKGSAAHRLGVALLTTSAGALPVFLSSALILQIAADLHFEVERLGVAVAAYFGAGVVSSAPMGRLSERMGPAAALRLGAALSSFSLISIAAAPDFATLVASLFLGGLCNALCQPAANLYVTRAISPARRGLALALKQSAIPAATLVGGMAVPLVALTVGWRWSFVFCAAMAAVTAAAVPPVSFAPSGGGAASSGAAPLRAMLLLAATVGCGAAAAGCLASFAVAGAVRIGMPEAAAGWLVAFGSGFAVATRIGAGYRADRRSGGYLRTVGRMLFLGGVGAIALSSASPWVFAIAVPIVFATGWGWPGLFNLAVITHNPGAPGAATGFTQTGTYLGAALGPLLFGIIAERGSWTAAWTVVPAFLFVAVACSLAARAELRKLSPSSAIAT